MSVPADGLSLPAPIPCEAVFVGLSVFFQGLELDPGASKGVSFTPGLRFDIGM